MYKSFFFYFEVGQLPAPPPPPPSASATTVKPVWHWTLVREVMCLKAMNGEYKSALAR